MNQQYEIINGDALAVMRRFIDEGRKFSAVFTDPPYNSGAQDVASIQRGRDIKKYIDADAVSFADSMSQRAFCNFTREWLLLARELLTSPGYFFIYSDWRQIPTVTDAVMMANLNYRGLAVWNKGNARPNKGQISQVCEFVIWGTRDGKKSDKFVTNNVIFSTPPQSKDRIHPTQKTPAVAEALLKVLPDDAEDVLDPFCGSASTGVAALNLGLRFTGIELITEFAEPARRRLEDRIGGEHAFKL